MAEQDADAQVPTATAVASTPRATAAAATERGSRASRRGRLIAVIAFALIYVAVIVSFALNSVPKTTAAPLEPRPDEVAVLFVPSAIDANTGSMSGEMYLVPGSNLVDADGRLKADLGLDVLPVKGSGFTTFQAGQSTGSLASTFALFGSVQSYPFDQHVADIVIRATTRSSAAGPWVSVPVAVTVFGDVSGWSLTKSHPDSVTLSGQSFSTAQGYGIAAISATRAISTVAIALMMLTLMVALAVLSVVVAWSVRTRRRRVEPTLAGWMAAMLFALVPLRNFLPGAPPFGSWIDVVVTFWVEIVIMASLAVFMVTWLRDGARPDSAETTSN